MILNLEDFYYTQTLKLFNFSFKFKISLKYIIDEQTICKKFPWIEFELLASNTNDRSRGNRGRNNFDIKLPGYHNHQ